MATLKFVKHKATDAITAAIASNGESLSQQISDRACELLADKIPEITDKITNAIIQKLKDNIDSDEFSEDFVNILQQKLTKEKKISEPFIAKFSSLIDKSIEQAEEERMKTDNKTGALFEDNETGIFVPPVEGESPIKSESTPWIQKTKLDGDVYWVNEKTNEITENKPDGWEPLPVVKSATTESDSIKEESPTTDTDKSTASTESEVKSESPTTDTEKSAASVEPQVKSESPTTDTEKSAASVEPQVKSESPTTDTEKSAEPSESSSIIDSFEDKFIPPPPVVSKKGGNKKTKTPRQNRKRKHTKTNKNKKKLSFK